MNMFIEIINHFDMQSEKKLFLITLRIDKRNRLNDK
jgi:hypothetical protein